MSRSAAPTAAPALDVDTLLRDQETRIIVCTGAGGVGKTTVAAALGLRAAESGRRVVVFSPGGIDTMSRPTAYRRAT